jgi:predicted ATPase/class 3 adenylate cyclase
LFVPAIGPDGNNLSLPTGTVTFFFSDIEGSTRLVESLGAAYGDVLREHRLVLRGAFAANGGIELSTEGDSFFVAFPEAGPALAAAVAATRGLDKREWPGGAKVRVRIGLHTGEGRVLDGDYVGLDVHRAARIAAAGHGGQILLSATTRVLVERSLPGGVTLRDLGEHRLKDLPAPERLSQLVIEGLQDTFPALKSLQRQVQGLPAQLPGIVGRERDIASVIDLVDRSQLVTVTGPGGTGKTRLAQEVALQVAASGERDAVFVPLEALQDATLVPVETLRALHLDIAAARDPFDRLVGHLGDRPTLLVLDNLEQIAGAGLMVRRLLDAAPALHVLASSQAALHVAAEQEYALGPLPVDGGPSPAVELFVTRACAVRADFQLDGSNRDTVVAICTRLDGLPLAIELAAAQIKTLSPAAILERISSRLDALATRRDDVPERQRTLRATVAWSYDLLQADEQRLFRRFAIFTGGARLPEVEAIGACEPRIDDAVRALEGLVDRSLIVVRRRDGEDDRYAMFETMRGYGRELLRDCDEEAAVVQAHAGIYRDLARQAEPEFYRGARRSWLNRLADDHDNIRAALDQLVADGALDVALEMGADLWRFWQQRGHLLEARERLDRLLEAAQQSDRAASPFALSRAEEAAGSIRYWTRGSLGSPMGLYERALEHARESGNVDREAWAMYNLAFMFDFTPSAELGEPSPARAKELRDAALAIFRVEGDRRGIAESLWAMGGQVIVLVEEPERAHELLAQAQTLLMELGDRYGISWVDFTLAIIDAIQGRLAEARRWLLRAAETFVDDSDVAGAIVAVQALAALAARGGDLATAVRFGAAADAAARGIGADLPRIPPIVDPIHEARARTDPATLRRETAAGEALGTAAILADALQRWREEPISGA